MAKEKEKSVRETKTPMETELRLAGDPTILQVLFASSLMAEAEEREHEIVDLRTRYFDTLDRQLHRKGLALRVRASDSGFMQTLKAGDKAKAALLKRHEWEAVLDTDELKPDALPKEAFRLLPKAARKGNLQPVFTTNVQRSTRLLVRHGKDQDVTRIEAALDLGEIKAGSRTLPVAEIELELIEGAPEDLYHLALDLQAMGPLHLETRSKSARGFDELTKQPPSWHRARPLALDPSDTVDQAMRSIFESCFEQWLANHAAAIDGQDPEGVHQMRVGLRRLRSALAVFGNFIPADQVAWIRDGARASISALGPARDWDVFQNELLAPVVAARPNDPDLKTLKRRVEMSGRASYRAARKVLLGVDYTRFALRFGAWLEERTWRTSTDERIAIAREQPIGLFARKLLAKRCKRALASGRDFAELPIEKRHACRITLKKLRYAIEFFAPLFEKDDVRGFLARLRGLQEDLGHLNDVAVAETLLGQLLLKPGKRDLRRAAGLVLGWHARGLAEIEPKLQRDWEAFAARRPFWH